DDKNYINPIAEKYLNYLASNNQIRLIKITTLNKSFNMKYTFFASVAVLFIAQTLCMSDEEQKLLFNLHAACKPKTGATDEMAQRAMVGDFPDDPAFKKHVLCMTQGMGAMDSDGNYILENINKKLDAVLSDEALKSEIKGKCLVTKESPEETAFQSAKCFFSYKDVF
ncbi:unnamed protein product, partial [Phyllotreta striolata]